LSGDEQFLKRLTAERHQHTASKRIDEADEFQWPAIRLSDSDVIDQSLRDTLAILANSLRAYALPAVQHDVLSLPLQDLSERVLRACIDNKTGCSNCPHHACRHNCPGMNNHTPFERHYCPG
jgi:hypothetical protein